MRFLALALLTASSLGAAGCCNVPCDPCCPPCVAVEEKTSLFPDPPLRPVYPGQSAPAAQPMPAAEPAPLVAPPPALPVPPVPDLPGDAPPLDQPERLESK